MYAGVVGQSDNLVPAVGWRNFVVPTFIIFLSIESKYIITGQCSSSSEFFFFLPVVMDNVILEAGDVLG